MALVISSLGAGGAERVITTLANHWAASGHNVTMLTFERPGARPYYALDARVSLRQLNRVARGKRLRTMGQSLRRIFALRRAIRACDADLVVSFLAKINIITVLATRWLDVRVTVSERNNRSGRP